MLAVKLLEKLKLDDVVGAIPAHLFAGIWGTLTIAISDGQIPVQLIRGAGGRIVSVRSLMGAVEGARYGDRCASVAHCGAHGTGLRRIRA